LLGRTRDTDTTHDDWFEQEEQDRVVTGLRHPDGSVHSGFGKRVILDDLAAFIRYAQQEPSSPAKKPKNPKRPKAKPELTVVANGQGGAR
jgi:hypothetical protein